jgi:hypothetical protein
MDVSKCNKTQSKWCINKHGASKIIDLFEMYHASPRPAFLPLAAAPHRSSPPLAAPPLPYLASPPWPEREVLLHGRGGPPGCLAASKVRFF